MAKRKITSYFRKNKRRRTSARRKVVRSRRRRYSTKKFQPNCRVVSVRYADTITLDGGVGTIDTHRFRANSIYDPDYETGGHQPLGHDELNTLYDHYMVVGSKITCQFNSTSADSNLGTANVGIFLDDDAVAPTSANVLKESRRGPYTMCTSGSQQRTVLTSKFSPKKFFCVRNPDLPRAHGAPFGQDPPEQAVWHIWASGANDSADPVIINVQVTIDYLVRATEPRTLAGS